MENDSFLQSSSIKKKISGPDGLEAWAVACAACFINFVQAGLGRISGIIFVELMKNFNIERRQASIPISVRSSTRNLIGPVIGIFGQKYGVRRITIVGGIIGATSAALCFFADTIWTFTLMWGVINGLGAAMTTTLAQVLIQKHFKKYRTTAAGMTFSGGCVGSFLFPAMIDAALHEYGFSGTFLIISGIIANVLPAAWILKEPSWIHKEADQQIAIIDGETGHRVEKDSSDKHKCDIQYLLDNKERVVQLLSKDCITETNSPEDIQGIPDISVDTLHRILCNLNSDFEKHPINGDLSLEKVPVGLSITKNENKHESLNDEQSSIQVNVSNLFNDELILNKERDSFIFLLEKLVNKDKKIVLEGFPENDAINICRTFDELCGLYYDMKDKIGFSNLRSSSLMDNTADCHTTDDSLKKNSNSFSVHIKNAFKLHTKPLFLLICICRTVHFWTFMQLVSVCVDASKDKNIPEDRGKFILAALSAGDLLGRMGVGWITDQGYISTPRYMLIVMILQGAATATLPSVQGEALVMTCLAVIAFFTGSAFVRHPVLVSTYIESHEQAIAMGCMNFFPGLSGFAMPSFIGYFRDTLGSYDGIFYINGAISAFVGLLWIFEPCFVKYSKKTENEDKPSRV